ncbi:hypothetical protein [Pedobacter agri]|uniref:hypothetical protein n=1 Tax=Pedobacter agri TaxID=454586 RepID=UPI00277F4336|nr:hypothetical protein [Pedobacter agri]MDQ1139420.1 hypothetical protein [Pedobacter agri]
MATFVVGGVEKIEYAPASLLGVVSDGAWKEVPNIAPDSVTFTKNQGTKSSITPEDKDVAFINFFTPGEGDTLALGVLEQNPALEQELFNVKYTASTTTTDFKAKEKIANLAWRITTRAMKDGRKAVITMFNTDVQTGYANNLTKTVAQQLALIATLGTYRPSGETEDYIYSKKFVTAAGATIDSSTP